MFHAKRTSTDITLNYIGIYVYGISNARIILLCGLYMSHLGIMSVQ